MPSGPFAWPLDPIAPLARDGLPAFARFVAAAELRLVEEPAVPAGPIAAAMPTAET